MDEDVATRQIVEDEDDREKMSRRVNTVAQEESYSKSGVA